MDLRQITETYAVSPQISPEDVPAIVEAGFGTVICNRPDEEVPPGHQADMLEAAVTAAGLAFVRNPISPMGLTEETVAAQAQALEAADGPVFAYCASGNRSTLIWALTQAGSMPTDAIIQAGEAHGYNVSMLRGAIETLAARR